MPPSSWLFGAARISLGYPQTWLYKAFNNIRREPMWQLARHVGIHEDLISLWQRFLGGFGRRFQVHNPLGERMISNVGYPEGCPLSVAAMALLDWPLHVYMQQLAP